ncbi:GNAT family N-acetyltransferase [Candidatus Bathyarchaeota archaeon]|nr:GNAT family N-acetyltransferase [Candidatus Bathyarchaeota archaeon]
MDYERILPLLGILENPDGGHRVISSSTLSFFDQNCYRHKATFGITVHDDYQDLGLGTSQTNYMLIMSSSKSIKKIELDVVSHNKRAIKVCERCGFKKRRCNQDESLELYFK